MNQSYIHNYGRFYRGDFKETLDEIDLSQIVEHRRLDEAKAKIQQERGTNYRRIKRKGHQRHADRYSLSIH